MKTKIKWMHYSTSTRREMGRMVDQFIHSIQNLSLVGQPPFTASHKTTKEDNQFIPKISNSGSVLMLIGPSQSPQRSREHLKDLYLRACLSCLRFRESLVAKEGQARVDRKWWFQTQWSTSSIVWWLKHNLSFKMRPKFSTSSETIFKRKEDLDQETSPGTSPSTKAGGLVIATQLIVTKKVPISSRTKIGIKRFR